MTNPDGSVWRSFTIVEKVPAQNGRVMAQTGYAFDHDYELVPGAWRIQIELDGKILVTQEFTGSHP